jgi:hypothetical protein
MNASVQTLKTSLSKPCAAELASRDFERFEREVHALFIVA